tara:strand:+ start:91560 stop:92180 length:621 start_codon:yes stop_codon:yes gene_type:complete
MKTNILCMAFACITALPGALTAQVVTEPVENKEFLLQYYQATLDNLREQTMGLSEAQLQFKPDAGTWSVSQCLEHIVLTEEALSGMVGAVMTQPENPEDKNLRASTDEELIAGITDRSFKAKAPETLQPDGKYTQASSALEDLVEVRQKLLTLINDTSVEAMRNRIADAPFGKLDGYQYLLFVAGHTARHTAQIEELKAMATFPEN